METNNNSSMEEFAKRPRWIIKSVGVLLMIFLALLIIQTANNLITTFKNQKPANTISVSGDGKVTATPDLATVDIGVLSQGTSAADAQNQNNQKANKIIAFVKQQGIADADISTSQFNLNPQQDYSKGTPVITGYQVNQTITVKVHGVDKSQDVLNTILGGVVGAGANEIDDVSLSVENPDALEQQAQTMAIAAAKQKAQALAQAAGLTLGKVVNVSENSSTPIVPMPFALNSAMAVGGAVPVAPNIQTGSQEIDETMTVTFELK